MGALRLECRLLARHVALQEVQLQSIVAQDPVHHDVTGPTRWATDTSTFSRGRAPAAALRLNGVLASVMCCGGKAAELVNDPGPYRT
jgi:hypothetical protein